MIATISPPMHLRRPRFSRRAVRWLWPAALLALTPKCVLCVLAYAGLGVALGTGGREICGESLESPATWATVLAWLGLALGLGAIGSLTSCRRRYEVSLPDTHSGKETA